MKFKKINLIILFLLFFYSTLTNAQNIPYGSINAVNEGTSNRIAQGELLPISIKLTNFGSQKRVDVTITYSIFDSNNNEIYSESETVAVETTASFVKQIKLSNTIYPGIYTFKSSLQYPYQEAPAVSSFTFKVERKFFGLFQNDLYIYGGIIILVGIFALIFGWILFKRRQKGRFIPFDYSDIPRDMRTFYEILSDTIMQMRQRVGDDALLIASQIEGLKIDQESGRVLSITDSPSKIIATLVSEYEKKLGKKVSFSFRKEK